MDYDKTDIENFVRSFIEGVERGIGKDHYIHRGIQFELAIVKTTEANGRLRIFVADADAKYSKEKISIMKFTVEKHDDLLFGSTDVR